MEQLNLKLFDIVLDIEIDGRNYDLHNDFSCYGIEFLDGNFKLNFQNDTKEEKIQLIFTDAYIVEFGITFESNMLTLDNLNRGKYQVGDQLLEEYEGKKCYYLEFYEGQYLTVLSTRLLFNAM